MALKAWDLNDNGIPDYKEPIVWKMAWSIFSGLVRVFAPSHTVIRRGVETVDPHVRQAWTNTKGIGP